MDQFILECREVFYIEFGTCADLDQRAVSALALIKIVIYQLCLQMTPTTQNKYFRLTHSPPNRFLLYFLSASIFKVLQCHSKSLKMLSECQTAWIWMRRRVTAYETIVVNGELRVNHNYFVKNKTI